jgi:hypothetical protein
MNDKRFETYLEAFSLVSRFMPGSRKMDEEEAGAAAARLLLLLVMIASDMVIAQFFRARQRPEAGEVLQLLALMRQDLRPDTKITGDTLMSIFAPQAK